MKYGKVYGIIAPDVRWSASQGGGSKPLYLKNRPASAKAFLPTRERTGEIPMKQNRTNTQKLVGVGLFTAIVVVLQLIGAFIHFGIFSISLVLVPVVIGAALYGASSGAWLGFVFGVAVLISGDAAAFLPVNALGTILTVLVKGTAAGLCAGLAYRAVAGKSRTLAVILAAIICPVVNTGIFLIGCKLFFMETITGWATALGYANVGGYIVYGLVGGNFLFELLFNMVLSPVIVRLIRIGKKEIE